MVSGGKASKLGFSISNFDADLATSVRELDCLPFLASFVDVLVYVLTRSFQYVWRIHLHEYVYDLYTSIRLQMNRTILQTFEWHTPSSGDHYKNLISQLPKFSELGITAIWLPPGCKANNPKGNGYDIYDLWDLGEFDQKESRSTKWGSREDLDELIGFARECGIDVIWDAVINHKQAGDRVEDGIWAVEVDPEGMSSFNNHMQIIRPFCVAAD